MVTLPPRARSRLNGNVIALALALVSATAQSPALKPVPATTVVNACTVITTTEIEHALGLPPGRLRQHAAPVDPVCDYTGDGGQITVMLRRSIAAIDLTAARQALQQAMPDSAVRPYTVLPAPALLVDLGADGVQLNVVHGRLYLLVSVLGFGNAAQVTPAAAAMARKAIARLTAP